MSISNIINSLPSTTPTGIRVVQRPNGGARRDLLVPIRRRHGRGARDAATRHLVLIPALPDAQRLPAP